MLTRMLITPNGVMFESQIGLTDIVTLLSPLAYFQSIIVNLLMKWLSNHYVCR